MLYRLIEKELNGKLHQTIMNIFISSIEKCPIKIMFAIVGEKNCLTYNSKFWQTKLQRIFI